MSTDPSVARNVRVPMRDGVELAADIWRPAGVERAPVLLTRTPYGRTIMGQMTPPTALVEAGFLDAEPVRPGVRGARERPYRATGRTWGLSAVDLAEPELVQQVDLAVLGAHRAELLQAGPAAERDLARGVLKLRPESLAELTSRIESLLDEFMARDEPDGEALSYLWSLVARTSLKIVE